MENNKKPLYKRWWVIVLGVIAIFTVIGSVNDSQEKATQTVTEARKENRCINVSSEALSRIEIGLTDESLVLNNVHAVQSTDFEKVYFVSTNVKNGSIATFAINNLDGPATVFAVDDYAKQITDWPHSDVSQSNITLDDDGAHESRDCVESTY